MILPAANCLEFAGIRLPFAGVLCKGSPPEQPFAGHFALRKNRM